MAQKEFNSRETGPGKNIDMHTELPAPVTEESEIFEHSAETHARFFDLIPGTAHWDWLDGARQTDKRSETDPLQTLLSVAVVASLFLVSGMLLMLTVTSMYLTPLDGELKPEPLLHDRQFDNEMARSKIQRTAARVDRRPVRRYAMDELVTPEVRAGVAKAVLLAEAILKESTIDLRSTPSFATEPQN